MQCKIIGTCKCQKYKKYILIECREKNPTRFVLTREQEHQMLLSPELSNFINLFFL